MARSHAILATAVAVCLTTTPAWAQVRPRSVQRRSLWDDPQTLERVYQRMADSYLDRIANAYELSDAQREQVQARLALLKTQQQAYGNEHAQELRELRAQLADQSRDRREGRAVDAQQTEQLATRMRALWQGAPLMNPANVLQRVESLLPADQVANGRERWEQARQQRIASLLDSFGRRRGLGQNSDGNGWRRYVDTFCREFSLDDAQVASAMSILRDLESRRNDYRAAHEDEIDAADQLEDWRERHERLEQVLAPVDKLFEELKTRLDRIPTSTQIAALRQRASTQPTGRFQAAATTRPTDLIQQLRFNAPQRRRPASRPATSRPD